MASMSLISLRDAKCERFINTIIEAPQHSYCFPGIWNLVKILQMSEMLLASFILIRYQSGGN